MENRNETCNLFAMTFIEVKMAGWPELPNTLFFLQFTLNFLLYILILFCVLFGKFLKVRRKKKKMKSFFDGKNDLRGKMWAVTFIRPVRKIGT